MTEQEILNAVQDIFRDNFDDDTLEITRSTCADDIEDWDSLEQINLLTAIEKKFNIKFKLADVRGLGRGYPGRVVYGMLGASFFSTLAGVYLPGEHCLLHGVECKFAKPIFIGDTLTVKGTVVNVSEIGSEAEIKAVITNQDGKRVTRGIIKAGLAK